MLRAGVERVVSICLLACFDVSSSRIFERLFACVVLVHAFEREHCVAESPESVEDEESLLVIWL